MSGTCQMQSDWLEPSTFDYSGLGKFQGQRDKTGQLIGERHRTGMYKWYENSGGGQKTNNYDQFLRSNIDNEQDNRNFLWEAGHDHLPFRTFNSEVRTEGYRQNYKKNNLWANVEPGDSRLVPLQWNNPHASEVEVNIWIQDHSAGKPVVVPIRKPTCSGEGYQVNVIKFTIPKDFSDLGSKIPGFKGCNEDSKPMCTVQIYAHSVESRTYSSAFPIVIPGHKAGSTSSPSAIEPAKQDPWFDLGSLRELCRPSNDQEADIKHAVPRWARLVSDVYNHAYQNSDFSPYSGQQHDSISQNLQASAINKMVTGNRGELGKSQLTHAASKRVKELQALEDRIYKNYEALANKIIVKVGDKMKTTSDIDTSMAHYDRQKKRITSRCQVVYEHCFRCAEVGSLHTSRIQTNTYIPSYQLQPNLVAQASSLIPSKYKDLITSTGLVRIYMQTLLDLLPFFSVSQSYGIIYQQAMIKDTLLTMQSPTMFRKRNPETARNSLERERGGQPDQGQYATFLAKKEEAKYYGCPWECLLQGFKMPGPKGEQLLTYLNGRSVHKGYGTSLHGKCSACRNFYDGFKGSLKFQPELTTLSKSIIQDKSLPGGLKGVDHYPDKDGSARIGRPFDNGTAIDTPDQPDWEDQFKKNPIPTPAPPAPPAPPAQS